MKKIAVLGSTGSIGRNTLLVAKHLGIPILGLAAKSNIDLLEAQAKEFFPKRIAVYDKDKAYSLQKRLPNIPVVGGMEGVIEIATMDNIDLVVSAMVGAVGIRPTLKAVEAGITVGLANKEVLIAAGELIMKRAQLNKVQIIPIDSEHSAIFQCLQGESTKEVQKVILTASGGPFFNRTNFKDITPKCALNHPNWNMGPKVTVDSSTLMNKGLEVIEAKFLFNVSLEKIKVIIHPESIVHSFVEFIDNSLLAQIGDHDMKIPIQYALTYPNRKKGIGSCFDFQKYSKMYFCKPDYNNFPCLGLAYQAAKVGGTLPCFMNAANEVLVNRFLEGKINWIDIGKKLEILMIKHQTIHQKDLETLLEVDKNAREMAQSI